jgi:hypothetical protein
MALEALPDEIIMHIMKYITGYNQLAHFGALNSRMHSIFMEIMKHNYKYVKHMKIIKSYLDMFSAITELFLNTIYEYKEIIDINANYEVDYYIDYKNVYIGSSDAKEYYLTGVTLCSPYDDLTIFMYGSEYRPTCLYDLSPTYKAKYECNKEYLNMAYNLLMELHHIFRKYVYIMSSFRKICTDYDHNIYLNMTGEKYKFNICSV